MNETLNGINKRATIKEAFLAKEIPEDVLLTILNAGIRAPNASNMQRYCVVVIKDKEKQKRIGAYPSSVVLVFCVDINRWIKIFKRFDEDFPNLGMQQFLTGAVDAVLCAENMVIAAQSLGVGSRFTNGIFRQNKISEIIQLLNLPKHAFPVIALCLGYPQKWPKNKKSRLNKSIFHYETYHDLSEEDIANIIAEYNSKEFMGLVSNQKENDFEADQVRLLVDLQKRRALGDMEKRELWEALSNAGFLDPKFNGLRKPRNGP
jgi:nitroreductase